jgi:WD40 repeat protein
MVRDYGQGTRINLLRFASILFILCFFALLAIETTAQEVTPAISSVAWSMDGSMIAVGYGTGQCVPDRPDLYTIEIIDVATNQVLHTLSGAECRVMALEWSPDGSKLASASRDGIGIRIWDVATWQLMITKQLILQGSGDVSWSPDGTLLAVTDYYSEVVIILDATTGDDISSIETNGTTVDWSPDGTRLVTGTIGLNDIFVSSAASGQQLQVLSGHIDTIRTVDWSPDGTKLVSGSNDNTVRIWDAATGNLLLTLEGHTEFVTTVIWSPDSRQIASGSADGTIRIWDAETGELMETIQETNSISAVAWSPDGTQIAYSVIYGVLETIDTPPLISCTATIPVADTPSLLAAITSANTTPEPDTICLEAGTYTLDAPITSEITLVGLGAGAEISGTLQVSGAGRLTLRNVVWSQQ